MLDLAIKYQDEINVLWINSFNDPYYHYFRMDPFIHFYGPLAQDTVNKLQYVSVTSSLILNGYMGITIDRHTMNGNKLEVISFKKNSYMFACDFADFVCLLFGRFAIKKITWDVVVGSPHERTYNALSRKYGGKVCGYFKNDAVLEDGKYYDIKRYELFGSNFVESIKGTRLEKRSKELYYPGNTLKKGSNESI